MAEIVISLDKVSKTLTNRRILKDISFKVEQGDIFGYLGPNGAGKTTTIRVILGLFPTDSGQVSILGNDISHDYVREKVGFVLETDGLYDNITAYENLDYYCQIYGMTSIVKSKRIDEMLELVDLSDRAEDKVSSYSKGMRQKLALARAMVHEPDLLILDEPTAAVDPTGQIEVRQIILNLAHRGKTIFLSSHNLDETQRVCNRIALIDHGEIKLYGKLDELRKEKGEREIAIDTGAATPEETSLLDKLVPQIEALPYVTSCRREAQRLYLQLDGWKDISEIVAMISSENIVVEEATKSETSLEEIYAEVVKGEN